MLVVRHPPSHLPERRYVAGQLLGEFLGLDHVLEAQERADVEITLTGDSSGRRLVLADTLFATPEPDWLGPASMPRRPLATWDTSETPVRAPLVSPLLPVIYGGTLGSGSFLDASEREVSFGLDVFGSAFFMLTRYEELVEPKRDARGRFPAGASLALQEGFLDRPVVNEYVEVLWWALSHLWPALERPPRAYRVLPSHDVDWPLQRSLPPVVTARRAVGDLVVRRDPELALARLRAAVARGAGDLYDTFDRIMDASERHGLRSAFYFIAGHSGGPIDGDYSLAEPWLRKLLRRVHERGHEIGLHTSYETFRDPDRTRGEFETLRRACAQEQIEQTAWGGRQHFLRWENPVTWRNWDRAGLTYDSTLAFAERPGFRSGVCYEHGAFDLENGVALGLRERPLVVMDASLLEYGRLSHRAALAAIVELARRCRLFGGDLTLLWHNNRLASPRELRLYQAALAAAFG